MASGNGRTRVLLLDFDGTITVRDGDWIIAERASSGPDQAARFQRLVDDFERLSIGTAEYFEGWLTLLQRTPAEIAELARAIDLRPGLAALVDHCRQAGIELVVTSEGLDLYVDPVLTQAGFGDLPRVRNRGLLDGRGAWTVAASERGERCGRCLSCKGALARRLRSSGAAVALVGNGASDLCGAREAELVLARDGLVGHCAREGISCLVWDDFSEVIEALARW